jgi:hypothetical protein
MSQAIKLMPPTWNVALVRLGQLEEEIGKREHQGITARWEFGRELLRVREGKKLPAGLLKRISSRWNLGRAEISARMRFAEKFPTRKELSDAVRKWPSWRHIVHEALPSRHRSQTRPRNSSTTHTAQQAATEVETSASTESAKRTTGRNAGLAAASVLHELKLLWYSASWSERRQFLMWAREQCQEQQQHQHRRQHPQPQILPPVVSLVPSVFEKAV